MLFRSDFGMHSKTGRNSDKSSKINQDVSFYIKNFLQIRNLHFFGVIDGHGECGRTLAEEIKVILPRNYQILELESKRTNGTSTFLQGKEARKTLTMNAFEETQVKIVNTMKSDANKSGATTTLLFMLGKNLACANVGDSRAILLSEYKGKGWVANPLSIDHKPNLKEEAKRINQFGGVVERYKGNNLFINRF